MINMMSEDWKTPLFGSFLINDRAGMSDMDGVERYRSWQASLSVW